MIDDSHGHGHYDNTCEQVEPQGGKKEVEALGLQPAHSQRTGWTGKLPDGQICGQIFGKIV